MRRGTLISVGDLLRVYHVLALDRESWEEAAAHLGLVARTAVPASDDGHLELNGEQVDPDAAGAERPALPEPKPQPEAEQAPEPDRDLTTVPRPRVRSRVEPLPKDDATPPPLFPVLDARSSDAEGTDRAPEHEPLFAPLATRAILEQLISTSSPDGPVDVVAAVAVLARLEVLEQLPRYHQQTISRGAQILVDASDGMVPFARDQSRVLAALRRFAGPGTLEVLRFVGSPERGAGRGPRFDWAAWNPPARPKPIVVISDLGIAETHGAERALPGEWRRFAERARSAGCPVVALVPYTRDRVPPILQRVMAVVEWDRGTGVIDVQQATAPLMRSISER